MCIRDRLRTAGVLGEETEHLKAVRAELAALRALSPALRADLADVELALTRARKKEVRHFVWASFGVSPAALVPFLGLAVEGQTVLLAVLCGMVVVVEGWRWLKARAEVKNLEGTLAELQEEAAQSADP